MDGSVEGAIVSITPANAPLVVTDISGMASFFYLPAGEYSVAAIIPTTAQTITSTKVIVNDYLDGRSVDVVMLANRDADPTDPNDNTTGDLTVQVLREGSNLVAIGAIVSLSPATVDPQQVEGSGGAHFQAVPAGDYTMTATYEESDGSKSTASAHVTVDANVRKETGLLLPSASTAKGGTLLVRVYDATTGTPLNGALVSINDYAGSEFTNSAGLATFKDLPPGDYTVTADLSKGYESETVTRSVKLEGERTEIQIPITAQDLDHQKGTIYVHVSTADGKDLDFTYVSIHPEVCPPQMAGTGRVAFPDIPAGDYVVEAHLDDKVARQQVSLSGYPLTGSATLVVA